MDRPRPRLTMFIKLLLAYALPTIAVFSVFAWLALRIEGSAVDAEMGKRLASIALATADQIRGKYLVEMEPSEDGSPPRAWQNTHRKIESLRESTGAARIYLFRPDGTSLCDTDATIPIGHPYHDVELDRHELDRVFSPPGLAVSTVLFRGNDGRFYKAGYAPVRASEDDPTIVAALRVEAPADFFDALAALRGRLFGAGGILLVLVVAVSVLVAALITRPLRRLTAAAERIGHGELAAPIDVAARDEIGVLARTLEEMRQALRARDVRLQMMLAGIAHEVRNPLGGIELFAGILRDELPQGDERLAHVKRIEKELAHLKAVVSDFLEYARRPKPELRPLDLEPLLTEVRDLALPDATNANVGVEVAVAPGMQVLADATQLRRAILNLCRNAVQATPSGGTVTLAAERGDERLRIRVTDTGNGISPEERAKIFTPFFTTKEKGTGLGLAFVMEIVGDHGGTLRVDSEIGKGSTFTVELRAI